MVEEPNARDALRAAKALAPSASLLPTDITAVRPSTEDEVAQYLAMGGSLRH